MFERFGEFDSCEEINRKAAELLAAADTDAVRKLAEENGLDPEDAEDYIIGAENRLCSILAAALGKLDMEEADLEICGILKIWVDYIREMCTDIAGMAEAVRKKGKSLDKCMSGMIRFSYENKVKVSDKIVNITKVTNNGKEEQMRAPLYIGFPDMAAAKRVIREYYMGRRWE